MRKVRGDFGAELGEFNGEDDHVHLLAGYPPKVAVPALVNSLKRVRPGGCDRSYRQVNRHIMHGHFWSPSSFAASFGGAAGHHPAGHRTAKAPGYPTSGLTPP